MEGTGRDPKGINDSFRAGFATALYRECRDPVVVSSVLDHRDLKILAAYVNITTSLSEVMSRAFVAG